VLMCECANVLKETGQAVPALWSRFTQILSYDDLPYNGLNNEEINTLICL
jgi:hypothetical protein